MNKFKSYITRHAIVLALVASGAGTALAAPAFVQYRYVTPSASTSRVNVGFSSAQSAGNLNIVAVGWSDSTTTVASVTDTRGNAYQLVAAPTKLPGVATQALYLARNIAAAGAGGNVVTVRFSGAAPRADVRIVEYTGIDSVSPVDALSAATGNGTLTTSGSVTTSNANDLIFATNYVQQKTTGPGAGFIRRTITPHGAIVEDRVVTATGTYTGTAPQSPSGWYVMNALALRAGAGGVPVPVVTLSATPNPVAVGGLASLTWTSSGVTSCTASGGWSGTKPTSGSASTGVLTATTAFTLSCTGAAGLVAQPVTVEVAVTLAAPTLTFSATPNSILSGGGSTLTWSAANATGCTASGGWSGAKGTSGSAPTGALTATTTYSLTCSGSGVPVSRSATVQVATVAPAPTLTFSASPATVVSGGQSTLTWSSTDTTGCTASGAWSGAKPTGGSEATGALAGTRSYSITCTGPGGSVAKTASVTVAAAGASIFPLHVEAGKRYLVDAQGRPFLIQGDTAWSLITQLTREQTDQYLEDRRLKGFNTVLVELIEHYYSANPPNNVYGAAPFLVPGDFSTPNDAYFDHAEYVVAKAREKGLLVMITPAYLGFGGSNQGWYHDMQANGVDKLRGYGQYIATRFEGYSNVLWVEGGDYNAPSLTEVKAVVNGIRDIDATKLQTYHGSRGTGGLEWVGTAETWLNVNNIYTTKDTVIAEAQLEYNRSTMPYFLIEGGYEDESATATETRQQAWQTVLSGGTGQLMGQKSMWKFDPIWPTRLNTEGASTMVHLRTLLESRAWWTLEPDFANTFLTAGYGAGAARAPAARAADHSFAIIYVREVRDLTVDIGSLTGTKVQARWYDPTNGSYATVTGSPFTRTGSRVFRPTGTNARGKTDWVLVLDAVP